jgi:hypothetical protein
MFRIATLEAGADFFLQPAAKNSAATRKKSRMER